MRAFIYTASPVRVIFGSGTVSQVADEVRRLGLNRALVLSTPPQAEQAGKLSTELGQLSAGVFTHATMHTPIEITEQALRVTQRRNVDCLVALGGGSTTGLSKALALRTNLPQIVVPTTYAGSEATPILGQLEQGQKTTLRDLKVLPEVIIYDIELTLTLPAALSVTSGINAMAHAAEALYSSDANPVTTQLALNGLSALVGALPKIICDPYKRRSTVGRSLRCAFRRSRPLIPTDRDQLFRLIATRAARVLRAPLDDGGDVSLLCVGQAPREAVPVVNRRDPRATRSALTADAASRAGGPC